MGSRIAKTVEMGYHKSYLVDLPVSAGMEIGKLHGLGAREEQQDSFGISEWDSSGEQGVLLVLADGMGGMAGGEKASMEFVVSCLNYFDENKFFSENPDQKLIDMLAVANENVKTALDGKTGMGGTTAIVVYIRERELYYVSVGDSRLLLIYDGVAKQLNREHIYGMKLLEQVEQGEISLEQAQENPDWGALTSYVGEETISEIDSGSIALECGDRILMMTDGVYRTLSEQQILENMEYPVQKAVIRMEALIEEKQLPNQDNYTAVLVEIKEADAKKASRKKRKEP